MPPSVFAKAVGVNGKRGAIINFSKTDPEDGRRNGTPLRSRLPTS